MGNYTLIIRVNIFKMYKKNLNLGRHSKNKNCNLIFNRNSTVIYDCFLPI